MICPECGAMVSNLRKHYSRNRCKEHRDRWACMGRVKKKGDK